MRLRWWLLAAVLSVAALAAARFALREQHRHGVATVNVDPEPFAARGWHSGSATRRIAMARHMTKTRELVGLHRSEMVARLGPPTAEEGDHLEWFLGQRESSEDESGVSWMFPYRDSLDVLLNQGEVCVEAHISSLD